MAKTKTKKQKQRDKGNRQKIVKRTIQQEDKITLNPISTNNLKSQNKLSKSKVEIKILYTVSQFSVINVSIRQKH